jgi:SAM-dependent methyltransferase
MTRDEIRSRRDALIARDGPWRSNIRLAEDVYTIGEGDASGAVRVRRVVQVLRDLTGNRLALRRVLDAGCGEGAVAVELARQGAEVVALDGWAPRVAKATLARDAMQLKRMTVVQSDARTITPEALGYFDVALALDLLCDLDADALFEISPRFAAVATDIVLVSARVARHGSLRREHLGVTYRGEIARKRGRDAGAREAFHLTRASLLNLLVALGFTSIAEVQDPEADAHEPMFVAFKGRRVALQSAPHANAAGPPAWREERRGGLRAVLARRGA